MTDPAQEALHRRASGRARNGEVFLREFDAGVVTTLGAVAEEGDRYYWLTVAGIQPPPGEKGILVTFSSPEDVFAKYQIPFLYVNRDTPEIAMQRWHPGSQQYRTSAPEAQPAYAEGISGFDSIESMPQAVPFDITYTINVLARHRGAPGNTNVVLKLLKHVLRVYQPYGAMFLTDSIGDRRSYETFMEGVADLTSITGITERVIGHAVTIRVEGELDLNDPYLDRAVTHRVRRLQQMR